MDRSRELFWITILVLLVTQPAWAGEHPAPRGLWHIVQAPLPLSQPLEPKKSWVLRDREIALDLQLLHLLKDAGARPLPRMTVELFDRATVELDVISTVSRINDTAIARGTLKPPARGDFTFAITGNLLIGTIHMGDRLYKTEHVGNGRLLLIEIDPDKMPPD